MVTTPGGGDGVPDGVLSLWFGFRAPVSRRAYTLTGLGLGALKYLLDNLLVWLAGGAWIGPMDYLNPALTIRLEAVAMGSVSAISHPDALQSGASPVWFVWALGLISLPFIWIGVSMSMRRARDTGWPTWIGLLFFAPFVNLLLMLVLCIAPTAPNIPGEPATPTPTPAPLLQAALVATMGTLGVAVGFTLFSVFVLGSYGSALFVGTPFVMGVVGARLVHRGGYQGLKVSLFVAMLGTLVAFGALLLFALEGVICLTMASPLALCLALLGALTGDAMARGSASPTGALTTMVFALPVLAALPLASPSPEPTHSVVTTVEIEAPPEVVWANVIRFDPLPEPEHWLFRAGVAAPLQARIDGAGVGAVRTCEFSTGAFVEPITVWDPPRRLAFDVIDQPPSMREMGVWPVVHAPHVEGTMESQRGEFLLTALPNGRTRLQGTTWYTLKMAPSSYWTLWSDEVVHQIHQRVLEHIRRSSERPEGS